MYCTLIAKFSKESLKEIRKIVKKEIKRIKERRENIIIK